MPAVRAWRYFNSVPAAALVFAAAPVQLTARLRARLSERMDALVVAADDGATTALAFGLTPDLVIGDLDSISSATLSRLRQANVPIQTYPRDKDATDGELAVDYALRAKPGALWLVGFLGGSRLDQALANVLLLTRIAAPAVLLDERNEAVLVRPGGVHAWRPEQREVVSLLPLRHVRGARTVGLRWRLDGASLSVGGTRGISNEPVATEASVAIDAGLLLVTRHFAA